jgi:hypothetical protein
MLGTRRSLLINVIWGKDISIEELTLFTKKIVGFD